MQAPRRGRENRFIENAALYGWRLKKRGDIMVPPMGFNLRRYKNDANFTRLVGEASLAGWRLDADSGMMYSRQQPNYSQGPGKSGLPHPKYWKKPGQYHVGMVVPGKSGLPHPNYWDKRGERADKYVSAGAGEDQTDLDDYISFGDQESGAPNMTGVPAWAFALSKDVNRCLSNSGVRNWYFNWTGPKAYATNDDIKVASVARMVISWFASWQQFFELADPSASGGFNKSATIVRSSGMDPMDIQIVMVSNQTAALNMLMESGNATPADAEDLGVPVLRLYFYGPDDTAFRGGCEFSFTGTAPPQLQENYEYTSRPSFDNFTEDLSLVYEQAEQAGTFAALEEYLDMPNLMTLAMALQTPEADLHCMVSSFDSDTMSAVLEEPYVDLVRIKRNQPVNTPGMIMGQAYGTCGLPRRSFLGSNDNAFNTKKPPGQWMCTVKPGDSPEPLRPWLLAKMKAALQPLFSVMGTPGARYELMSRFALPSELQEDTKFVIDAFTLVFFAGDRMLVFPFPVWAGEQNNPTFRKELSAMVDSYLDNPYNEKAFLSREQGVVRQFV